MRQAYRYTISSGLAMQKGIPRCFVAVQLLETARGAVYLYGHGASDPTGRCCQCGRTLTHPVSILVGIGPECGGHWWDESVLGPYGMTEAHIDRLRTMVTDRLVDTWIPKAAIKSCDPVDEAIAVPADHKMLQPKGEAPRPENGASTPTSQPTPTKTAHLDKGGKFLVARFPYDPKDVENIRRLEGRRWDSAKKEWTAWASQENINLLLSFGFSIDEKLTQLLNPTKIGNNLSLYFSLCPLYNNFNGSSRKGEDNAQRGIPKNAEPIESLSGKPSKRQNPRSAGESQHNIEKAGREPCMEGKGVPSDQISHAQTRSEKEAFGRAEISHSKAWNELPRRERAGTNRNSEADGGPSVSTGIREGIFNTDQVEGEQLPECARCLQSRLCQPKSNDSHRIGWGLPQKQSTERQGQEEDQNSGSPWMDCPTLKALMFKEMGLFDGELANLYDFQRDGILWLESKNGKGLIGDSMGLGKTIQAIGWIKLHPEARPAFIVVPASLKLNWERELRKWLGQKTRIAVLSGKYPAHSSLRDINIINYDVLGAWLPVILESRPKTVVVDESHYIKNPKALRTKAVKELVKVCKHSIFLTGTPITNRPAEFFTTLNLLEPREFSSWFSYVKRYCGAYQGRFGWEIGGATHTEELHARLVNSVMIRRRKEDVLKDLPAKRRNVVPMEINNRAVYNVAEEDLLGWLREKFGKGRAEKASQAEALARFNYLKQLAAEGALEMQIQWIKDSLDSNGKLVIFAVHHATIDKLSEELRHYGPVVVDGRVSIENRQKAVDAFQNNPDCRVFIGNIRAAGVGLTLTASSNTVFAEVDWVPANMFQAEDRVHRIGQEAESINAWYLVPSNTIVEEIMQMIENKSKVLDAVLDGKSLEEGGMFGDILKKFLEK